VNCDGGSKPKEIKNLFKLAIFVSPNESPKAWLLFGHGQIVTWLLLLNLSSLWHYSIYSMTRSPAICTTRRW
jgi:hypothetical protein